MLFKSIGSFLAILTCGLSLHATDLPKVENDSPMPFQQTGSAPWGDLPNEIWVNIFKFLPLQEWPCLLQVNKIFGELIKENAPYLASHNPEVVQIFQALGGTETGMRNAREYFFKNLEGFKEFWDHFFPLTNTLNEIEKGRFRYQGAFGEPFEKAKQIILKHDPLKKDLSLCRGLSFIPREIANLKELECLDLSFTQLVALPPEITKLIGLIELDLSGNKLRQIPSQIWKLEGLRSLDVSKNEITEISWEITKLTGLETLSLGGNKITEIPSQIWQLMMLKNLYLNNNPFTLLPGEIGNLKKLECLDLSCAQLLALPPEIAQLTKLEKLHLINNLFFYQDKKNIQAWFEGREMEILF